MTFLPDPIWRPLQSFLLAHLHTARAVRRYPLGDPTFVRSAARVTTCWGASRIQRDDDGIPKMTAAPSLANPSRRASSTDRAGAHPLRRHH